MLGFVEGKVLTKNTDTLQCVIRAGDLGYEITVPKRTCEILTQGENRSLWLHTHVREDLLQLYGFETENEKIFFRLLLTVSGLGPKTALSLLSEHGSQNLIELISHKQTAAIAKAPGVGKKIAERLVMELSGKAEKLLLISGVSMSPSSVRADNNPAFQLRDDLSSALLNLGYQPTLIKNALDKLFDSQPDTSFENALRFALKELSGRPSPVSGREAHAT